MADRRGTNRDVKRKFAVTTKDVCYWAAFELSLCRRASLLAGAEVQRRRRDSCGVGGVAARGSYPPSDPVLEKL